MTKSDLVETLYSRQPHLQIRQVDDAVRDMLEYLCSAMVCGERIEIRGFGSFTLHYRSPRIGRNPKTGDKVPLVGRYVPHFKPGKELRERVNGGYLVS